MRVAISGVSGTLGTRLRDHLERSGHQVIALVRRPPKGSSERQWDPEAGTMSAPGLEDVDAVVNLSGAPIAGFAWTKKYRKTILDSRLQTTSTLVEQIRQARSQGVGPTVFLSASAVGYYGPDTGNRFITETSPKGPGFLACVASSWEDAANQARSAGTRVINLRTANVLAPEGGLIKVLRIPFLMGAGGRMGSGKQWFPWITAEDHVRAMTYLLESSSDSGIEGPVNLAAPQPVRNKTFVKAYAASLGRPALIPFPSLPASLVLTRTMVEETVLAGQRAIPKVLSRAGFKFNQPTLQEALSWLDCES